MGRVLKRKLKGSYGKPKAKKLRKRYETKRCDFIKANGKRCSNFATGKGSLCKIHGGKNVVKENLLKPNEIPIALALATKYDPAQHPLHFIELSASGMSLTECAAVFQVSASTLTGWGENFDEMYRAIEIGKAMHEAWYLTRGKNNLTNPRFNTGLFKFLTTNKLGYAEKIETKNMNMNAHGVLLIPNKQTEDEWEQCAAETMERMKSANG